jgi:hypothetical protein
MQNLGGHNTSYAKIQTITLDAYNPLKRSLDQGSSAKAFSHYRFFPRR